MLWSFQGIVTPTLFQSQNHLIGKGIFLYQTISEDTTSAVFSDGFMAQSQGLSLPYITHYMRSFPLAVGSDKI